MIVSLAARRENRKSDWPWRKRAEQKLHAEFSVGRSSIIGARYRPVTQTGRQAGRPGSAVVHLLDARDFPLRYAIVPAQHGAECPSPPSLRLPRPVPSRRPRGTSPRANSLISSVDVRHLCAGKSSRGRDRGRYGRICDNAPLRRPLRV